MKSFNLASLIQSKRGLEKDVFESYLKLLNAKFKPIELECLEKLYDEFSKIADLNNFYMGYVIPQIGKEFDLLRFGKEYLINIELKSDSDEETIIRQLRSNRYYLSFIDTPIHLFSYLASENKFYKLTENDILQEVELEQLISLLNKQNHLGNIIFDSLFVPSKYLVSPFNSTEKFMENNYFLTENQEKIKNDIVKSFQINNSVVTAVTGDAGTGKTLLTYDIAKQLMGEKSVVIIHCANLNTGQARLIANYGWDILPAKDWEAIIPRKYDVVIVDEAQRMYTYQLERLYKHIVDNNINCIFSYDGKQCFSDREFKRKNPDKIENEFNAKKFQLTKKIRTNKEIVHFVTNLFEPRQGKLGKIYENVEIMYFEIPADVKNFTAALGKNNWEILNFTSSSYYRVSYDRYQNDINRNAHQIIGQEFDKVVAIIDSNFYFDQYGYLRSRRVSGAPDYDMDKMLYQIMTRARDRLMIIILNNQKVLNKCIKIVESEKK